MADVERVAELLREALEANLRDCAGNSELCIREALRALGEEGESEDEWSFWETIVAGEYGIQNTRTHKTIARGLTLQAAKRFTDDHNRLARLERAAREVRRLRNAGEIILRTGEAQDAFAEMFNTLDEPGVQR